jgi:hypothetical protein
MSGESIPAEIVQFITEKIDSVAQLEALLLLRDQPDERWSVQALARRLYIDETQTAELLTRLELHASFLTASLPPVNTVPVHSSFGGSWTVWRRYTRGFVSFLLILAAIGEKNRKKK